LPSALILKRIFPFIYFFNKYLFGIYYIATLYIDSKVAKMTSVTLSFWRI